MEISGLEKAAQSDRNEIVSIVGRAVEHLNHSGIPQWDEVYPHKNDVDEDIQRGQLYVARAEGQIAGIITLNQECDPEYQNGAWGLSGAGFHGGTPPDRIAAMQGRGIGTQMMCMAEAMLRENGMKSIRLDAFSQNPYSLRLYEKLGYHTVGEAVWRKGLFYLMEKDIGADR